MDKKRRKSKNTRTYNVRDSHKYNSMTSYIEFHTRFKPLLSLKKRTSGEKSRNFVLDWPDTTKSN